MAASSLGMCTSVFGHRNSLTADKIRRLAGTELDYLEIAALQSQHLNIWDTERVRDLAEEIRKTGLKVWSLHAPFCGMAMDDPETRQDGVRRLTRSAEVAAVFQAEVVVVHPGRDVPSGDRRKELEWTVAGLLKALDLSPAGTRVALETMGGKGLASPPEEMRWVMDRLPAGQAGVCIDTGHINLMYSVPDYIRAFKNRIFSVHLHDNHGETDEHLTAGSGNLDWPAVLEALSQADYRGPLVSEGKDPQTDPLECTREYIARMKGFIRAAGKRG